MSPGDRERLAVLVERRLAGMLEITELEDLSRLLERSGEARQQYLRAMEVHLDLQNAGGLVTADRSLPPNPDQEDRTMARMTLNCSCGWNFFIPGTTPGHEVNCPSCSQTVRIPGRKPGMDVPMTPGAIAAQIQRRQRVVALSTAVLAASILVGSVTLIVWKNRVPPLVANPGRPEDGPFKPRPEVAVQKLTPTPPVQPTPSIVDPNRIQELRHELFSDVWRVNMSMILSECLRYRGRTKEMAEIQNSILPVEARIRQNADGLARLGERVVLDPRLLGGDQIIGFAQRDLTTMKPVEAAQLLHTWINRWQAGPDVEPVQIIRGGLKIVLALEFPEDTKELLTLARHPALLAPPEPNLEPGTIEIPADLLAAVQSAFDALPPGYRSFLITADQLRLANLLAGKRGIAEDTDWLRSRILTESIPVFRRDADQIRSKVLTLESKLKESTATDVISRKNGTRIEGQIVGETDTFVKIKTRFGSASIPKDEIAEILRGKGTAAEFPVRYAEAKDHTDLLLALLEWCAEKNLKLEKEYVGCAILLRDASNEKARAATGLERPVLSAAVPGVPPPPGFLTDPAKAQAMDQTMEIVAGDVLSRSQVFGDVIQEMRRRTEGLTATELPVAPENFARGLAVIRDPLAFDVSKLTVSDAVEVGTWWSQLPLEDRRQFAKYYGLWCAVSRGRK